MNDNVKGESVMTKKDFERLLTDGWKQDKDYVFVSYASADWEKVYPTVLALRAKGINVYIDVEFREIQSQNWLDNFQLRLMEDPCCQGIVTFLSINYMRSYACLMEQLANRTQRMYRKARRFHPVFYSALEPQMGSVQSIESYLVKCRKESTRQEVVTTPPECAVLQNFIVDMHKSYGSYSAEDAEIIVKELKNKHDVATTMQDMIFQNDTPSFQRFESPTDYAELLYRNFVGDKNREIELEAIEELKEETLQRLRAAKFSFEGEQKPAAKATEAPAPAAKTPATETTRPTAPAAEPAPVNEIPQPQRRKPGRPGKEVQAPVQPARGAADSKESTIDLSSVISRSSEMKIGQYVRTVMRALSDQNFQFSDKDLEGFQTPEYTKKVLNLGKYELLRPVKNPDEISALARDEDKTSNQSRYWTEIFRFNGQDFLVCSQWYEKHWKVFPEWLEKALAGYTPDAKPVLTAEATQRRAPEKTADAPAEVEIQKEGQESENAEERKSRVFSTTGDITFTLYGKEYTYNQSDMMLTFFAQVLNRHQDCVDGLPDCRGMNCASALDYTKKENRTKDMPPYFRVCQYFEFSNGSGVCIGTAFGVKEKLKKMATLLAICGEDSSIFSSGQIELPEAESGNARNASSVTYKVYGKSYTSSQTEMLGTICREVIERHPDKLAKLADELMCVAVADYGEAPKKERPVYFMSLCVYDLNGTKYSIGGSFSMADKLRQIAKLLDICGVDKSEIEIEGHELPGAGRRRKGNIVYF